MARGRGRVGYDFLRGSYAPRKLHRNLNASDRVADNRHKWEITESESLLIGRNFGVGTIQTGPNGNLYIVSLTNGAIYEVFNRKADR